MTCGLRSAEQIRSLGSRVLDLGIEAVGEGGYARALTGAEQERQQQALAAAISGFDVVITTALVPGRRAPTLVSAAAVRGMRPGSVIVDLAGESGGNCELTRPGEVVVEQDVTIVAPLNIAAEMAGARLSAVRAQRRGAARVAARRRRRAGA